MIGKANTDKTVWHGDGYRVFVTLAGGIGIEISGHVVVKSAEMWHRAAYEHTNPTPGDPRIGDEDAIEIAAKAIYEHWQFTPSGDLKQYPWVDGGNSLKQSEARTYARAALESLPAAAPAVAPASGVGDLVASSTYMPLSDQQCDEFRRAPGDFNAMLRAVHEDGHMRASGVANEFFGKYYREKYEAAVALSAPSDAQPAQAVTDAMSDGQIMYEANYPNTKDAVRCPFNLLPEWNQNQWHRAAAERARSSQPPTAAQPAAVPAECVAAQQNALWEMKQRAQRAHQVCNDLRLAYPEITELGDDGVLHDAIHDILRVNTPGAAPPPPTSAESRGVG